MRIDPLNKPFLALLLTVMLGTIAYFITSIFIDTVGDAKIIQHIEFEQSDFNIFIYQHKSDKRYEAQVYSGDKWLQNVILGTDFGDRALQITTIENGYKIGNNANNEISFVLEVDTADFSSLYVKRSFGSSELQATDCVWLNSESVNWYGGPEQMDQKYPVQSFNFVDYAYITKELHSAAIMERYWLSSSGFFILVDYDTPLFIDQNNLREDHICFTAKKILPYDIHKSTFTFNYRIGAGSNARVAHKNVITRMLGHPRGLPEERMIRYPIWNTWVRYQRNINENTIRSFANEIVANDFKYSLLDIDDFWEDCYGSLTVNQTNFGNLRDVTTELHELGFIVGMWVHPFVNKDCATFAYATEMNLLVKSHNGSTDTSWWNSRTNQAAHVDFTNPQAMSWFKSRLEAIQRDYGVDIFKFDAGETSWFPEDPVLNGNSDLSPSLITQSFVSMAADFGTQLEIRTGWGTQHLHVFVRMLDFDSRWTADNGLKSLIPTLLQFNLNGYVFVLPDMIGGNQYGDDTITSELFIRWLQASVFMPALQFSVAPWDFDAETITISRQFTELHASYADLIIERFNLAVSDGEPVNPPIWWLDPEDAEAQVVDDEYLLGETILVAPVIEEGKTERDVYLPAGTWKDGNSDQVYTGKQWIRNYAAPLSVLPYFIRQ